MQGLQTAVNGLAALVGRPREDDWQAKAKIVCDFATAVGKEMMRRCGFDVAQEREDWKENVPIQDFSDDTDPDAPEDVFAELWIVDVPATLTLTVEEMETHPDAHIKCKLLFGRGRVLEGKRIGIGREEKLKIQRVMTYDEAARYVIFWIAEKMLQVMRKNNWDRVQHLPDLYDRLVAITVELGET